MFCNDFVLGGQNFRERNTLGTFIRYFILVGIYVGTLGSNFECVIHQFIHHWNMYKYNNVPSLLIIYSLPKATNS